MRLATGPVSWGVDFADSVENPPWSDVLDDIRRTGLGALELGPVGYLPEDPDVLGAELERRGLDAVGSFVFEDLHDPTRADEIVVVAERASRVIQAAGGTLLVVIDRVSPERAATFGRSSDARRLDPAAWRAFVASTMRVAEVADSHGLTPVFHPHAGTFVEFADEIDRLLDDTPLALCLDTGHAHLAGLAAPDAAGDYGARLTHIHLKDVDGAVAERAGRERLDFWAALAAGVFCPIGRGAVDFRGFAAALAAHGPAGVATIEQDRVPGSGHPVGDLLAGLTFLAGEGFADAALALASAGVEVLE